MTSTIRRKSRVPMWVRQLNPGLMRSYLIAVFLPPNRTTRLDFAIGSPPIGLVQPNPKEGDYPHEQLAYRH